MSNRGLLFIPDISGFTKFVHQTDIEHSRLIIQELLETLINTNQIGLEISEIEGDAILFYKFGDVPDLAVLYKQVERMFCEFHKQLIAYAHTRFCQCKACVSSIDLTLKVITHYGEFTGYNVKNFSKLIGKDIIVAHQLLKNDISLHEYWLVTKSLTQDQPPADLTQWMKWDSSTKQTETGEIPFHYTQLSELKFNIKLDPSPQLELSDKAKVLSFTREYATDMITLFHAVGDHSYRPRWQEGVRSVDELHHFLPRVGTRSRVVLEDGQEVVYASSYSYGDDWLEFSETDENKQNATYFTLVKQGPQRTKLTIDIYIKKTIFGPMLFGLTKKSKIKASYERSLQRLDQLIREIPNFDYNPDKN